MLRAKLDITRNCVTGSGPEIDNIIVLTMQTNVTTQHHDTVYLWVNWKSSIPWGLYSILLRQLTILAGYVLLSFV